MWQLLAKIAGGGVAVLFVLFCLHWLQIRWTGAPDNLGVTAEGKLAPCPDSPNCVTTQGGNTAYQQMNPLSFEGDVSEVSDQLIRIVEGMPNTTIITDDNSYIHAEFRSPTMGYVDDVEFYIDEEEKLIHFRSKARLGYGDMGANRERMKTISRQFMAGE
ncbi:MAG TPA: DUF1499 domain-containing protein [Anaerolineae bacterium]|nr:DUF1499 domain-containing protein [Anaerolineae bacterium]